MLIHNALITGSLSINGTGYNTGSFSGSFIGAVAGTTATASYVEYNNVANKPALVSGSSQITYSGLTGIPSGIVSGSSQVVYSGLTGIPSGIVSGSSQVTYSGLTGIPSGIVSGSAQVAGFGIFATTGSNQFNGNQAITGSLTTTGQIIAQTLNVQQVTSSIVYSSGSNIFGNSISNTQQFTGSISASGSMSITPGITVTGDGSNDMFKAVRAGNTRFVVKNAVNSVGINTDTINNPLTVNGGADFSGNVGIGVTSSNAPLEIQADSGGTAIRIKARASANSGTLRFFDNASSTQLAKVESSDNSFEIGSLNNVFAAFLTNATERMRITSGGNVGIGTISPGSYRLNIETSAAQGIQLNGTGTGGSWMLWSNSGTANGYIASAYHVFTGGSVNDFGVRAENNLTFGISSTERMRITSGGNVGIGTTSPGTRLEVSSTAPIGDRTLPHNILTLTAEQSNAPYGGFGGAILFKNRSYVSGLVESSRIRSVIYDDGAPNNFGGGLWFETTPTPGGTLTPSLVINYQGRVGIGTTSPSTTFNVGHESHGIGMAYMGGSALPAIAGLFTDINSGQTGYGSLLVKARSDFGGFYSINFFTAASNNTPVERMRITSGGSLQINYNPGGGDLYFRDTTNGAVMFYIIPATYVGIAPFNSNRILAANSSHISFETGGAERMRITSGGNIIHTSNSVGQGILMAYSGGATYGFFNANNGTLVLTNSGVANVGSFNMTTGVYTATSDINKKKDFEESTIGLDAVMELKPTLYRIKSEEGTQKHLGFIAQEVKDFIPQAYVENGDFIGINEMPIIAALTKAIQELKSELDTAKAEIELLKQQ